MPRTHYLFRKKLKICIILYLLASNTGPLLRVFPLQFCVTVWNTMLPMCTTLCLHTLTGTT